MNWYTAKCLFRSIHDHTRKKAGQPREYRYFLLKASNDLAARRKAEQLAKQREHRFRNAENSEIRWVFEQLVDMKEILAKDVRVGTEVSNMSLRKIQECMQGSLVLRLERNGLLNFR